jgi:membrane-bound serine protease (ClpP class)
MVRQPAVIRVGPRAASVGRLATLLFAAATAWITASAAVAPQAARDAPPVVYVAPVDGIIHPISAEFILEAIDTADTHGAAALIIPLETPGGLVESTRTIITRLIGARTPIVIFVGTAAGRAASAGFLITLAADVAVMSPAAHIGAAHPVSGSGEKVDETMAKKAASDVAAYARSLAQARRRNVKLADEAVLQSRSFTADEALHAEPPLIDFTATSVDDVLRQLDGREISRFDGRKVTLHTAGARTETLEMSRRQRFLSAIAHPQIAYILFTIGLLGLTVEMWNPGSILPGVAGGLCLLLAFLAFQILPINTTGVLLVLFGIVLLVLELKIPSFGVLGIGGAASLILGSVVMMNRTSDVRVDLQLIVPAMLAFTGIFLFLGRLALNAQRRPAMTGATAMIAETGRAQTAIPSGGTGYVAAHGEIWIARATRPVDAGAPVRIVGLDGLTLTVEPLEAGSSPSSSSGGPVT